MTGGSLLLGTGVAAQDAGPPTTEPVGGWSAVVGLRYDTESGVGELVVFDTVGVETGHIDIGPNASLMRFVATVGPVVALHDPEANELVLANTDTDTVTHIPVAIDGSVQRVVGSDDLLITAASRSDGPGAALIDIATGAVVGLASVEGVERPAERDASVIEPISAEAVGSIIVVTEGFGPVVHLIDLAIETADGETVAAGLTFDGYATGVNDELVAIRDNAASTMSFIRFDGADARSFPLPQGFAVSGLLHGGSAAIIEPDGTIFTLELDSDSPSRFGAIEGTVADLSGAAVIANGEQLVVGTENGVQVFDASGASTGVIAVDGSTFRLIPRRDDRCVVVGQESLVVVDPTTRETATIDSPAVGQFSDDACTILSAYADQIIRDNTVIDVAEGEQFRGLSADGRFTVTGPTDPGSRSSRVIDLDDRDAPAVNLDTDAWQFTFLDSA